MKNSKKRWLSALLAFMMVFGMLVGGIPAYAEQDGELGQTTDQVGTEEDQTVQDPGDVVDETEGAADWENEISVASIAPDDVAETAVITAPDELALDGTKSYVILTSCLWGGHTYGIGPDGTATEGLGFSSDYCAAGNTIYLAQEGLGWTLTQTEDELKIQNGDQYLVVSEDGAKLETTETETVSGLSILPNGTLGLKNAMTKSVYLQETDSKQEPKQGDSFKISAEGEAAVFYFAEVQKKQEDPEQPEQPEDVLFPTLLPQENFRAEVVSPDKVYGDDQYVIFTQKDGDYVALTSSAGCSSPLTLDKEPAVGVGLSSADQNVLWTVNNNRQQPVNDNYYKYIRSCASNKYLAANDSLLDDAINCDFYLAGKDGSSALIATAGGQYVTIGEEGFELTTDQNDASRFYFAKLLQENEQQSSDGTTAIPEGTLLRLVDWNSIEDGKTYAIINATEFNKLHYALSGSGRLARYEANNLSNYDLCPNKEQNDVYGNTPCESSAGDIFYTNGQDILWTASNRSGNTVTFQSNSSNLYLKTSGDVTAEQTPSVSEGQATVTFEPASDKAYAYLSDGQGHYLGIWQYIAASVSGDHAGCSAWYLAEVLDSESAANLPATQLEPDSDQNTASFGGLYSVYQGSQHLLNDGTGVENFILMDDGTGSFKPSNSKYDTNGKNNYFVTYCADYKHGMPKFTSPGKYEAVSLDEYDKFTAEQKSALQAIISNSYPYVTEDKFLDNMRKAGFEASANCGSDEIMAGIQAAIYSVTNPREDGEQWGYESSDGWAHNVYEVNKPKSYVSDHDQAKDDVNAVRDYLWSLISPAAATTGEDKIDETNSSTSGGITTVEGEYFALTTEINGNTWALGIDYAYPGAYVHLMPYKEGDIRQMWYVDEHGSLQSFVGVLYPDENGDAQNVYVDFSYSINSGYEYCYFENGGEYKAEKVKSGWGDYYYYKGKVPVKLNENGTLSINDYDKKIGKITTKKINDPLRVVVYEYSQGHENEYYNKNQSMMLDGLELFTTPTDGEQLMFQQVDATPQYPVFVDYDMDSESWDITYNNDKTYNVKIDCTLNFPTREDYDDIVVSLWCNNEKLEEVEAEPGKKEITVEAKGIPDGEEAHFWISIEEIYAGVSVFIPENEGWQVQVGAVYNESYREIHEETTSIPVEKIWKDTEDHSGDPIEVCLTENEEETSYIVTLDQNNSWKGAFKHVPYERWSYYAYGKYAEIHNMHIKVPLKSHKYGVKELNVKPGYTSVIKLEGVTAPEEGHKTIKLKEDNHIYSLQAVSDWVGYDGEKRPYAVTLDSDHSGTSTAPYEQGKENQLLYLNGDGTLVGKSVYKYGNSAYTTFHLEESEEAGKYYIYTRDNYNSVKLYFEIDTGGYFPFVWSKDDAVLFELRDYHTGDKISQLPTDSFEPVKAALKLYEDGKLTDKVVTMSNDYNAPIKFSEYQSWNPFQKFTIYSYNGQYLAFEDANTDPEASFALFPCEDGNEDGEYIAAMIKVNGGTGEEVLTYIGLDAEGNLQPVEKAEDALHLGLMDIAEKVDSSFEGTFTVTNTPCGSLKVSKTVSGNDAETDKEFIFNVSLDDKSITGTYGDMEFTNGEASIKLKPGYSKIATNLPRTGYTVVEIDNAGYTVTVNDVSVYKDLTVETTPDTLTISREESVSEENRNKAFTYIVTLDSLKDGKKVSESFGEGNAAIEFKDGVAIFTLEPGEKKIVKGLPVTGCEVVEIDSTEKETVAVNGDKIDLAVEVANGIMTISKPESTENADKTFNYTLTLGDKEINGKYGAMDFKEGVATFTLKPGEKKSINGLPDTTYEVVERDGEKETATVSGDSTQKDLKVINSADTLTISKPKVEDIDKEFTYVVMLNDNTKTGKFGDMEFKAGVATFTLKYGDTIAAKLPSGISSYKIVENGHEKTIRSTSVKSSTVTGTLIGGATKGLVFNNEKSNTFVPGPSYTSVTARKVWKLDDGGKAADSITVVLLKDGVKDRIVTLNDANNWTHTWTGLEAEHTWTVDEINVPEGFESTVQKTGSAFVITNDDQPTKPDDPTKPEDPEKPEKPDKPDKPGKPSKPGKDPDHSMVPDEGMLDGDGSGSNNMGAGAYGSGSGSPQTGDSADITPWLIMMGISVTALAAILITRRKKAEKHAE